MRTPLPLSQMTDHRLDASGEKNDSTHERVLAKVSKNRSKGLNIPDLDLGANPEADGSNAQRCGPPSSTPRCQLLSGQSPVHWADHRPERCPTEPNATEPRNDEIPL